MDVEEEGRGEEGTPVEHPLHHLLELQGRQRVPGSTGQGGQSAERGAPRTLNP